MKDNLQLMKLGDVINLQSGFAFKSTEYVDSGHFLMRIANVQDGCISLDKPKYVALDDKTQRFQLDEGDILTSLTGNIGRVARVERQHLPAALNQRVARITPKSGELIDDRYLFRFLSSPAFSDFLQARSHGAAQANVSPKTINEIPIPLPPLEQQRRIVAVLDEAFEGLARARAHAEANLQNAQELFESLIAAALEKAGGEPIKLGEMLERGWITGHLDGNHGSDYPRKDEFVSEGVPYISANCIAGNVIDFSRCKYLTPERADQLRKGIAKDRDVIFAHNATVGPVALLETDEDRVILSTSLTYYRCNEAEILPEFLAFEMRSAAFRRQYEVVMTQATRNQVPITMQRTFTHLIPSLDQQRRIAGLGIELEERCGTAVDTYRTSLKDLEELRQSLLQKAFSGELT